MKKILSLLLTGILLLSILPVSGVASEVDTRFVGDWYLNTVRVEDTSLNAGDMDAVIKVTIEGDGTATWTDSDGSQYTGTWTSEGDSMLISWDKGGMLELMYVDGAIVSISEDGVLNMHFEGFPPEKTVDARPPWRRDVTAEDFDGQWMSIEITVRGMVIPMSQLGERVDPLVSGGKVIAINGMAVDPSVTTSFIGATLVIYNPIISATSVMNLNQDGSATLMHVHAPEAYFTLIPEK